MPSAANLKLHEGSRSHVNWHCDDESLFGGIGDSKLIVSLSLGSSVTFKWKAKSCSDSEGNSCRLHHGDLLVMDGRCQDEYLHCTSPGLAEKRMNITYRWIRHHIRLPVGRWSVGFLTCLCSGFICFGTWFWGLFCSGTCVFGVAGVFVLRIVNWACSINFLQNWVWGSFSPLSAILPFG